MGAEKLISVLLQLKKPPSINDECQTQRDVWPAKKTSILLYVDLVAAGQETKVAQRKPRPRGPTENVSRSLSTLLGLQQWTFKTERQLSLRKPTADIWDSWKAAFAVAGGGETRSFSCPRARWKRLFGAISGYHCSAREYYCNLIWCNLIQCCDLGKS